MPIATYAKTYEQQNLCYRLKRCRAENSQCGVVQITTTSQDHEFSPQVRSPESNCPTPTCLQQTTKMAEGPDPRQTPIKCRFGIISDMR